MKYKWGQKKFAANPQLIGDELERIRKENGNNLSAEQVIDSARGEQSVLYSFFNWNDTEAAHQYRLVQARGLIRSIDIVRKMNDNRTVQVQAFVNISYGEGYETLATVLSDEEKRGLLLAQALKELEYWRHKYDNLSELASVQKSIDRTIKKQRKTAFVSAGGRKG